MKKLIISIIFCLLMFSTSQAQDSITIHLSSAGTLANELTFLERKTVLNLRITGEMDARDFKFLRDSMFYGNVRTEPIQLLDIADVSIVGYSGKDGTFILKNLNSTIFAFTDSIINYLENALPDYAFYSDDYSFSSTRHLRLRGINLPSNLTAIGAYAFYGSIIDSIVIPQAVKTIGNSAFEKCIALKTANIASVAIGNSAFSGCKSLATVVLQPTVSTIGKFAFESCDLKTIDLPESVTVIDTAAFRNCKSLFSLRLPSSITKISRGAFSNLNLEAIYNYSSQPVLLESVFDFSNYSYSSANLHVPAGSKELYRNDEKWGQFANILDDVASTFKLDGINYNISAKDSAYVIIGDYSGAVTIPSIVAYMGVNYTVSGIERYAFAHSNVSSITIPATVTKIEDGAFFNASKLATVTISDEVTSIGTRSFMNCSNLKSLSLPSSLNTIENSAFENCTSLVELAIPPGLVSIGHQSFMNCSGLKSLSLPTTINTIDDAAFKNCTSIAELTIPSGLVRLGDESFMNCSDLQSINLPTTVRTIGDAAFANCTSLTEIMIPSGVKNIGGWAFAGCTAVAQVSIPASVENIDEDAFFLCAGSFSLDSDNKHYAMKYGILCEIDNNSLLIIKCPAELATVAISTEMKDKKYNSDTRSTNAFAGSKGSFVVDGNNDFFSVEDGVLYNKDKTDLIQYPVAKSGAFKVPATVSTIRLGAFWGRSELTQITIPLSVTDMGSGFSGCTKLSDIYLKYVEGSIKRGESFAQFFLYYQDSYLRSLSENYNFTETTVHIPWLSNPGANWHYYKKVVSDQFAPWAYFRAKVSGKAEDISTWEASYTGDASSSVYPYIPAEYAPTVEALGAVVIDNDYKVTVTDSLMIPALYIGNGWLTVNSNARLLVRDFISNNNGISLLSDQNSTATFIGPKEDLVKYPDYTEYIRYGHCSIDQYLTAGRNWYVSSPIMDAKSAVFNAAETSNTVYSYDETKGNTTPWQQIKDIDTVLGVGKGYVYSPSQTGVITFNGKPNHKKETVELTRTAGHAYEGYNLIGNPFTAYLDWSKINTEGLMPSIWYKTVAASS